MGMFDMACPVCGANLLGPNRVELENASAQKWVKTHKHDLNWLDELVAVGDDGSVVEGTYDLAGGVIEESQLDRGGLWHRY